MIANIWVPGDVQSNLLQLLTAGQLHYAVMRSHKLRYRHARIIDCQFHRMLDEYEDLPDV